LLFPIAAQATLDTDGGDDCLESSGATSGLDLTTTAFTVAFWFQADTNADTNTYIMVYEAASGSSDQWAVIYEFSNNVVEFFTNNHTGTNPRTGSQITIADTDWHHIAYVFEGTGASWAYWLDGVETVISATLTSDPNLAAGEEFFIGCARANSAVIDAHITDVYVWDAALTDHEMVQLANSQVKGIGRQFATANLQGAWLLDDLPDGTVIATTDTFVDLTTNGNDMIGDVVSTSTAVARAETILSYP